MDKVRSFEAHTDYIRCVAVHPSLSYILTSSDDMLVKVGAGGGGQRGASMNGKEANILVIFGTMRGEIGRAHV